MRIDAEGASAHQYVERISALLQTQRESVLEHALNSTHFLAATCLDLVAAKVSAIVCNDHQVRAPQAPPCAGHNKALVSGVSASVTFSLALFCGRSLCKQPLRSGDGGAETLTGPGGLVPRIRCVEAGQAYSTRVVCSRSTAVRGAGRRVVSCLRTHARAGGYWSLRRGAPATRAGAASAPAAADAAVSSAVPQMRSDAPRSHFEVSCSWKMAALAAPETRMLAVVLSEVAVVDESGCSALVKHDIMPAFSTVSAATRLMRTLLSTDSTQLIEV